MSSDQGRWLFRGQHTAGKCTLNVVFKRNNASNLWTTFLVKYDSEDGVAENLYPVDKRNIKHYRTRVESLGGLLDRVQEYGDLRLVSVQRLCV